MKKRRFWLANCLVCLWLFTAPSALAQNADLLIFAAASTTNAIAEAGQAFEALTGIRVLNSLASSSTLAKQIAQGAPADVFISANVKWMDYLEKNGAIAPDSRFNLLRNRLVLIAPAAEPKENISLANPAELLARLGDSRLALGDPDHVPAGIYAKQALVSLGLWENLRPKLRLRPTSGPPWPWWPGAKPRWG